MPRDENRISTLQAVLNTDGITPTLIYGNSANHSLKVSDDTTGSDFGNKQAVRDENRVTSIMAVSSVDGKTLVPLYADNLYNLLIQST